VLQECAVWRGPFDLFYGADLRSRLPHLERFDAVVDATYTGILKPERRAYELCLERLGAAASDCVFVDDQPRNVAGAAAVGLRAVCFDVREPAASFRLALELLGLDRSDDLASRAFYR
jgi:putative hydrolase of the HAD superfamily